jgi:predicted nucleotidyltransferase/DNA-binding transcriptional regulator YhcF (GntR family)
MRTSPVLDALFPAVRQRILAATLLQPDKWWYLTELASHLGTSPSSLQRELESLTRGGLLERKQDGRRIYHRANTGSPTFSDLESLFAKTAGLVPALQIELEPFGNGITWAFLYGSVARSEEGAHSDVDVMVVGSVATADLAPALKRLERRFGREINVTRYSEEEFCRKARNRDHFLASLLEEKRVMLKGSARELAAVAGAA